MDRGLPSRHIASPSGPSIMDVFSACGATTHRVGAMAWLCLLGDWLLCSLWLRGSCRFLLPTSLCVSDTCHRDKSRSPEGLP
ncbi:hypothetical protein Y1Q_0018524 [Alligator mississippiensis]|uniref:Uncharacterized protein n=1 Tax=Alligator mississippiensis TaxID=8496 RepID=A0A151P2W9_ALLMI|nr:hypothetical protein Y1Q_0018524 [Alligator mississippiensis]